MKSATRSAGSDAAWLTVGTTLSALAIYLFLAVGTRAVGVDGFAPVSVLWSLWAVSGAALTFPVQHWIIRTTVASGDEAAVWSAMPRVWALSAVAGVSMLVATWVLSDALFGYSGLAFPALAALLPPASVAMGVNRGVLSARGEYRSTAMAILGENVIRVLLAVAVGSRAGSVGFGVILVVGFMIAFAYPSSFRPVGPVGDRGREPIGLLGGLTGANLAAQTALTSGPVVLSLVGGSAAAVTTMFSVLALLRAPYTVALGASARLTAPLSRRIAGGEWQRLVSLGRRLVWAVSTGAVVAGLAAPWVLPPVVRLVFDVPDVLGDLSLGLLAAGSLLAFANLLLMLTLLAMERGRGMIGSWVTGLLIAAFVVVFDGDVVARVSVAFLLAEIAAMLGMLWSLERRPR